MDDEDVTPRRTWLAAERTFLAWWRTALATAVAAIAVGRFLPEAIGHRVWPYVLLGLGYCVVAVGIFVAGMLRHREIDRALRGAEYRPLSDRLVLLLSIAGVALTLVTALIIALAD
jgi:putative membrane protein